MKIVFDLRAQRDLKKLDSKLQQRIVAKLEFFAAQDKPVLFAERLVKSETGDYRFRIGDYRIICDIGSDTIEVFAIGHRREIYR